MKIFTVFTLAMDNHLLFDTFDSFEKAEHFVNDNTDSNIKLVGGDAVLYEKFGTRYNDLTKWKPELVNDLFPFNNIEYGTTVRETKLFGLHKGEFDYTYRFIIESEIK